MIYPRQKLCLPELLVKASSVGHEGRHEKHVTTDGGYLAIEGVTFFDQPLLLLSQASKESLALINVTEMAENSTLLHISVLCKEVVLYQRFAQDQSLNIY